MSVLTHLAIGGLAVTNVATFLYSYHLIDVLREKHAFLKWDVGQYAKEQTRLAHRLFDDRNNLQAVHDKTLELEKRMTKIETKE